MQDKFDISLYNDEFFNWHLIHAREYSIKTMDWFVEKYKPKSVVDFGCGIGSYLESAHNHGILIEGYDISPEAKPFTPEWLHPFIKYQDCTKEIKTGVFDCVLSFETAEHIDPEGTRQFVKNLVDTTGKYLLFSAAPPGQDGCGHINCHPKEYWIGQFVFNHKLNYGNVMTKIISDEWRKLGAPNYICDNLIVFKK